jgi:hypothetical protein
MTEEAPTSPDKQSRIQVKVYVVCMRRNLFKPGENNVQIIAARLTRAAAQAIVDRTPGTFIEKLIASK